TAWEIYKPSTGVFALTTMAYQGAGASGVATASGKVLIVGGFDKFNTPSKATILVDGVAGTAVIGGNPLRSRYRAAMVSFGEVAYVIGGSGFDDLGDHVAKIDVTVSPLTWVAAAPMGIARNGHTATVLTDGTVLVVGGGSASAQRYNRTADAWSAAGT